MRFIIGVFIAHYFMRLMNFIAEIQRREYEGNSFVTDLQLSQFLVTVMTVRLLFVYIVVSLRKTLRAPSGSFREREKAFP